VTEFKYECRELELFAAASNWKSYWHQQIKPFLRGDILEVGAGIGSNTALLKGSSEGRLVFLEPDGDLFVHLVKNTYSSCAHEVICGTLQTLNDQQFDTIIYIDVLEHIEHDGEELRQAALHLRSTGHLIIMSPAHQCLFSPFDAAIGHFRRYNRAMLYDISPPGLRLVRLRYIDSIGLIASAANLLFLRQSIPTEGQIRFWDQLIVPLSRVLDSCFGYKIGKSIVAVWYKPEELGA
jgi:hypothetical protein